jgi:lipoyl(octanoyl) transferase
VVCQVLDLGVKDYMETYQLQRQLVKKVVSNLKLKQDSEEYLLVVQHPKVYTIGRAGSRKSLLLTEEEIKGEKLKVYEIDRGGDITFHGPGQLIFYPILNLANHGKDLHQLIGKYEEVVIRALAEWGINGQRIDGYPGVWVHDRKIAAIGIGVSGWVTYHGFAINIDLDLRDFTKIIPCGIKDKGVTSMVQVLEEAVAIQEVKAIVIQKFAEVFKVKI